MSLSQLEGALDTDLAKVEKAAREEAEEKRQKKQKAKWH